MVAESLQEMDTSHMDQQIPSDQSKCRQSITKTLNFRRKIMKASSEAKVSNFKKKYQLKLRRRD